MSQNPDRLRSLWQVTPSIAIMNGFYDGAATAAEVREHGDLGIGAWDHLNGEAVLVDGTFFQVLADGSVHQPSDDATLPFAQVTFFEPEAEIALPGGLDYAAAGEYADARLPTVNAFYGLRLEGTFQAVMTRSLPSQSEPYPPLSEVVAKQPTFEFSEIRGTMVGFRTPHYVGEFCPAGYHLHFLSEDRSGGGHVLSLTTGDLSMSWCRLDRYELALPRGGSFESENLDAPIECP